MNTKPRAWTGNQWWQLGAGKYAEAISLIKAALHLLVCNGDEEYQQLKARLLANWAYNVALLQNQVEELEKLDASRDGQEGDRLLDLVPTLGTPPVEGQRFECFP
jgi:hypothetical protein